MAISVRSVTTPAFDSSPYDVPAPAGVQEGDLLLLQIHAGVEVPDGWTLIPKSEFGIDPIFYRVAGASEPATYTVTVTQSGVITAAIIALYSDTGQPLSIEAVASQHNASSLDRTWPAAATTATENMICCLGTILGNAATTPTAGFTEQYDTGSPRMYAMTAAQTGAGTVGPFVAVGGIERESNCRTIIVAEAAQQPFEGPQYRGRSASTFASANGSASVGVPTELEVGDFMLLQITLINDRTPVLPSGWTLVNGVTGSDNLYVYSKVAEAGDIGATITATYTAGTNFAFMGILAYFSPRGRAIIIDDFSSLANSAATDITFDDLLTTVAPSALAYMARLGGDLGITVDAECAERWEVSSGTRRAYAMNQLWFAAGATGTRTATWGATATSTTLAVALVEVAPILDGYAVADTYDEPVDDLVALDPQPRSKGVEITRRPHSPSGSVLDQELYLWLEWDYFATAADYQSVLTQLGLLNALTNQITISARDQHFVWRRYNGIVVKPQVENDGEWNQYFLRGVKFLVKNLQLVED